MGIVDAANVVTYVTMGLLFAVNLLNYVDRYTLVGVLTDLKNGTQNGFHRNLSDTEAALLQTGFILSYMIFSPLFGYLGDRYNRKNIMSVGILIWACFTGAGSLSPTYWVLLLMRSIVGIGEASYITIAPTIIADLFSARSRIRALSFFYIAIPVGSALGYGVGAGAALVANVTISEHYVKTHKFLEPWRFALRVTPILGILLALLIWCVMKEPTRGQKEGVNVRGDSGFKAYLNDVRYCFKIRSYIYSALGFAMGTFAIGALAQWVPLYVLKTSNDLGKGYGNTEVSLIFGAITVVGGLAGTICGSESAKRLRPKTGPAADCLVCAAALLSGGLFVYGGLTLTRHSFPVSWILVFFGVFSLCLCWAPVTAIVLNVIVPERRSTAAGMQILISHILGDAISPLITGFVSDSIRGSDNSDHAESLSLQRSLYITCFAGVIGGAFYLIATFYMKHDEHQVELYAAERRRTQLEFTSEKEQLTNSDSNINEDNDSNN